ncbi:MAG: hypothetical protein Q8R33_09440 [Burkholderiales bacterium]|nr:hypothetical protein [Burkholderiales bacterium]
MKNELASAITVGAMAVGATAMMAFANGDALADDITIDNTPFVSAVSRDEVKGILKAHPDLVRRAASEWALQENQAAQARSTFTSAEAKAAYIKERREVAALNGEDSGSSSPWVLKARPGDAAIMGAPAR